ncbi:hypothetical protein E2C01_007126 [Portunus trituberculatus]|uniref:Uncharacterized protein n=1 Tax=Portunus trituberculatus TaxID=210409 RepID=A0A5B7CXA7_PORTR|nr:hypothetical protein [Portunus trituberculatus]
MRQQKSLVKGLSLHSSQSSHSIQSTSQSSKSPKSLIAAPAVRGGRQTPVGTAAAYCSIRSKTQGKVKNVFLELFNFAAQSQLFSLQSVHDIRGRFFLLLSQVHVCFVWRRL